MRDLHEALNVNVEEDLLPLSALLHQRGVAHRIFEENGRQVVVVQHAEQAQQVAALYRDWRAGKLRIELAGKALAQPEGTQQWRSAPVTVALILLSIGGFLLIYLHAPMDWLAYLTFTPFQLNSMPASSGRYPLFESTPEKNPGSVRAIERAMIDPMLKPQQNILPGSRS